MKSYFVRTFAHLKFLILAQELRVLGSGSSNATKLMHNMDDCSISEESTFLNKSTRKNHIPAVVPVLDYSFHSYLKFGLLCGLFTLEGTRQAVAGADFTGGLQSVSFFGDLSDISSGFASVRKISL